MAKAFWMVAAPNERVAASTRVQEEVETRHQLGSVSKISMPTFRVGTLDSLMSISDRLAKDSKTVEVITERLLRQYRELAGGRDDVVPLVDGKECVKYIRAFEWDEARFASTEQLQSLVAMIMEQVARLEDDLKMRATDYTATKQAKSTLERKSQGTLMTKSLGAIVTQSHVVETEHMSSEFVVVNNNNKDEFVSSYESLGKLVVPRSLLLVLHDNEFSLYRVIVFKKGLEEFRANCRERRYNVREFKYDPEAFELEQDQLEQLVADADTQADAFTAWSETAYGDAFVSLVHLKILRVFVESVLRYGLPVNFELCLIAPNPKQEARIRMCLADMYAHLLGHWSSGGDTGDEQMIPGVTSDKEFYPYVFDSIPLPS
ncbi:V-type proton ATPase subunit C 1-A [Porphyridium purpureum]|uniref:V-type proton ATPase subunit C n=1 Tax=Porphyridium purpureum TaxID=35688 RepID=A0A5J4Z8G9_PORPP|nr:V-type proton ATPase subunit C 1-A [Porphyridium purpureum]|eukprot:POR2338..scf295_1